MKFQTINPATGAALGNFEHLTWPQAEKSIHLAHAEFRIWKNKSYSERANFLMALAQALKENKAALVQSMHLEMGKSESEGRDEVDKCVFGCEFYAENGATFLARQTTVSNYKSSFVSFKPLGVILCIMPWNFPLWQVVRFAAPSLMAGNVVLMKHSDITAGTAVLIEKCFLQASGEKKIFQNIHVDHEVCEQIIGHKLVQGVTFTGSSRGGREIAKSSAAHLKKTVLELGGSDPYIVLADADLEKAAKICATARLVNCGQSCVAAKRFVVEKSVSERFTMLLIEQMKALPLAPLAHKRFQKQIIEQVEKLKTAGGKVLLGGTAPEGAGAYYPATLVQFDENPELLATEELFGPVAAMILAENVQEALRIANSTQYGLGGALFTQNIEKGLEWIEKDLDSGFVVLNDQVKSDPRLPFGGIKESGYGRELGSFGIHEFVNTKTVAVGE